MKTWNIFIQTPDSSEERVVKAETLKQAIEQTFPDNVQYCWGVLILV